jgi:hypothetical protein
MGEETLNIVSVWTQDGTSIVFMKTLGEEEAMSINIINVSTNQMTQIARSQ